MLIFFCYVFRLITADNIVCRLRHVQWLSIVVCLSVSQAYGQAPEIAKPSDVRLVIDISGSMKKNDPQNLRRPALEMLVQLLPKGSKAGIWTFGQYVNMLVPHQVVDKAWGTTALSASSEIKSIAQFTNIGAALEKAAYDHQQQQRQSDSEYQTHVILLTDGMVDIDRDNFLNKQERQRIVDKVLPMYQQANITLHTIALSDNADKNLLNQLALATDGKVAVAKNAEELMNVFLQVFNQAVPLEELAFDGEKFAVDSSIEEFTALIFRKNNAKPTTVVSPDGQQYTKETKDSRVNWHHTNQYDLITVKQPLEGEWGVSADVAPQSRVTVVSDLRVAVKSMPTNIAVDDVIDTSLVLREENKTITRTEFLDLLDITVDVTSSTGNNWTQKISSDQSPNDGVYSALLNQFNSAGEYTINFLVEGKTFNRQYMHQLSVRTPFSVTVNKVKGKSASDFSVEVVSQSQDVNIKKTKVSAIVKSPKGNAVSVDFAATEEGTWRYLIKATERGDYIVDIRVDSIDNSNAKEKIKLETLRLSQESENIFFSEPEKTETPKSVALEISPALIEDLVDVTEKPMTTPKNAVDYSQYILYGIIGGINLIIIFIGYMVYRKLFKAKPEESEEDAEEEDQFVEPPMDEMAVEELVEEEQQLEELLVSEPEVNDVEDTDDLSAALLAEDDEEDDEIPDFSLDEFSPDSLENDEEEVDLDK